MKVLLVGAVVGVMGLGISAASAAPAQPMAHIGDSPLILAQGHGHHGGRDHREGRDHRRDHRPHFVAGRRYSSAPNGWHRFDRRPGDWRTRGCVLVGPLWFCP